MAETVRVSPLPNNVRGPVLQSHKSFLALWISQKITRATFQVLPPTAPVSNHCFERDTKDPPPEASLLVQLSYSHMCQVKLQPSVQDDNHPHPTPPHFMFKLHRNVKYTDQRWDHFCVPHSAKQQARNLEQLRGGQLGCCQSFAVHYWL